jgi:hypothetical protein
MNSHKPTRIGVSSAVLFMVVAVLVLVPLFWHSGQQALVAMDAPAYQNLRMHSALTGGSPEVWYVESWLGMRYGTVSPDLNLLALRFLHYPWSATLLFTLNLLIAGGGMVFLLRTMKLGIVACAVGGMAFMLTNDAITLAYAGHVNKLMTYAWIPWSIAFFLRGVRGEGFRHYVISGAFFGLGLLAGEVQILYYLGLWYTVWLALSLWKQRRDGEFSLPVAARHGAGLVVVAACALVLGFCATHHHWKYLGVNTPVVGAADTTQNWLFATQYFFPPEEVLSFFTTTQFFGGAFAYWGRCGSPQPLRLSDDYMGLLPIGFAILGGIACWRIWQARLFIFMAVGSLLISFGREGGIFWLLYQLPTMKSQRNPHRWTYFVSLAVCVLAAYGINWLWERLRQSRFTVHGSRFTVAEGERIPTGEDAKGMKGDVAACDVPRGACGAPNWCLWKRGLLAVAALGVVLFALAAVLGLDSAGVARTFYGEVAMASPQGPLFAERARCMLFALTRTGFFLAASAFAVWWVIRAGARGEQGAVSGEQGGRKTDLSRVAQEVRSLRSGKGSGYNLQPTTYKLPPWLPWAAVLLVLVADLGSNAKRYIVFYPWKQVLEENPLANFLRQDKELYRVKVIGAQQNAQLNNLVSNILPYHRIPVVDPPAVSRMPNDYGTLFKHFEQHYVRSDRYFDFFNVKYVLSPGPFADENTPFVPIAQWNGINVYRRENSLPRAWLAANARVVKGGDEEVLKATLHPLTDLRETVVVEEPPVAVPLFQVSGVVFQETKASSPAKVDSPRETRNAKRETPSTPRSVRVTRYEDNRVEMATEAGQSTILVLGDKWDPDWKAWVDGVPARILKANFLMRGVELATGKHVVRMEYRPSTLPFKVSAVCVLLFAGYGLWAGFRALRPKGR